MNTITTDTVTKDGIFKRIQEAVRDFFKCPDEDVFLDTVAFDIDGWDSLAHATFMLDLEDRFSIQFSGTEVLEFQNISSIVDSIYRHLLDGIMPHNNFVPEVINKTNSIDQRFETVIFAFNNSQVIQAQEDNGFWQELEKTGFETVKGQSSRIDWQDNYLILPCLCNPKDPLRLQIKFVGSPTSKLSGLKVEINGKHCVADASSSGENVVLVFRARDFLDQNALEGTNRFRIRMTCHGAVSDDVQLQSITIQRSRWVDGFKGKAQDGDYSGESLWGDLWRVGSRQFLMQMNASFHNNDGTSAEGTQWHVVGDSHAVFNFAVYRECKTHYVNAYSVFHLIKNPLDLNAFKIPDGANVVFVFGEIDCRTIIGSMADRIAPLELATYLADEYANLINDLCRDRNIRAAICLPAPPYPKNTATDTMFPVVGTISQRAEYTRLFCEALRAQNGKGSISGIIDAYTPYASEDGLLDRYFAADEAHLRPDRTDPLFAQARDWAQGR